MREFMDANALKIKENHSSSIAEHRNHNTIFMILQFFFTLPLCIIIIALICLIEKKNNEVLKSLNNLNNSDLQQVEKKYRRYFSFKSKQKKKTRSKFIKNLHNFFILVSSELSLSQETNETYLDFDFEQKFIKKSKEYQSFFYFHYISNINFFKKAYKLQKLHSNEHNENSFIMTESGVSAESHLINIKSNNYKKNVLLDSLKIIAICLISMIFLVMTYIIDQKSIANISNINSHLYYLNYRPICVRYNLLFSINEIYDNNDCNCPELINYYRANLLTNELAITKTNLPWEKLKKYYSDFKKINYNDLCTGIFEILEESDQIMSKIYLNLLYNQKN